MNWRVLFSLAYAFSTLGLASASAQGGRDEHRIVQQAGWPVGWTEAYERFESFCLARQRYWPHANLEITSGGYVVHEVPTVKENTEHLALDIFKHGTLILGISLHDKDSQFNEGLATCLSSGTFAACMKSSGLVGYQHEFPIFWFTISPPSKPDLKNRSQILGNITPINPPGGREQLWPNERSLLFLDYHVLPHHLPQEIDTENCKVNPSLKLKVDNHGVIWRGLLMDTATEQFLRWRIYYNGRLIESGLAAGVVSYKCNHGPGNYVVWLGIEGPHGFMPVSNLLNFPLFPEPNGEHVIYPAFSKDKAPQCVEEAYARLQVAEDSACGDPSNTTQGHPTDQPHSFVSPTATIAADNDQLLIDLWKRWKWHLQQAVTETGTPP